jgi:hypothetical protein
MAISKYKVKTFKFLPLRFAKLKLDVIITLIKWNKTQSKYFVQIQQIIVCKNALT